VKLFFGQNLSPRLIARLADLFPNSNHVFPLGLDAGEDSEIWEFARKSDIEQILRNNFITIKQFETDATLGLITLF
jgi:predicted nuclease of predicted toxin-antitoxin system